MKKKRAVDPAYATARDIAAAVASRGVSATEMFEYTMARARALNPALNAFIWLDDDARSDAREIDESRSLRGLPLAGVPISVKDLIITRRGRTTGGSRIFGEGLSSDHDAPVVRRLKRAGAVIFGKNNLHELALGVTNFNEHFGPARNPWDTSRVPGGSSGGSGVAVAAGIGPASVGSDTRGSIRIPAACCGITGLKATYGRIPADDVIPLAWSLDHVGPMTRTVEDCALVGGVMAGGRALQRWVGAARRPTARLTIGVCEYFLRDLDPEIERAVRDALDEFRKGGAKLRDVTLPEIEGSHGYSAQITVAEAGVFHEKTLREHPEGIGPLVRGRLEGALKVTGIEVIRAQRQQEEIRRGFRRVFEQVDCIVGACIPALPATVGNDTITLRGQDTTVLAQYPRLTSPTNLSGTPALALPCGYSASGLPIGLQLMSAWNDEITLFRLGGWFQERTDWHERRAPEGG